MKFIKEHLHRIVRILVNQLGVMIFALVTTLTATSMGDFYKSGMTLVASLGAIALYLFLVFYSMREEGTRDSVKIAGSRLAYDKCHGLWLGLLASIPNYVFVLLMALGLLVGVEINAAGEIVGGSGVGVWSIGYFITSMIQSMYVGVLKFLFGAFSLSQSLGAAVIAYAVTPLLAPLAAWGGYAYGVHRPIVEKRR